MLLGLPMFSANPDMSRIFSTDLWTGTGSSRSITTGVDLSGSNEGLVWTKERGASGGHFLFDTIRGTNTSLSTNDTGGSAAAANSLTSFTSSGFSLGTNGSVNAGSDTYVGWTFKSAPGFFDVVQYTGNGGVQAISHSLGTVPGAIVLKQVSGGGGNWDTYHRSLNAGVVSEQYYLRINSTSAEAAGSLLNNTSPSSSQFTLGNTGLNASGETNIAYLFGHEPQTNGRIFCGGFTTDSSGNVTVSIGWRAGFVMMKRRDGTGDWIMLDTVRGWTSGNDSLLVSNRDASEVTSTNYGEPTATGFTAAALANSANYIFIAIRAEGF